MRDWLDELVREFSGSEDIGIALFGSYSRGDAQRYSDVDLLRFRKHPPETGRERYSLVYRKGRLISVTTTTIAEKQAELSDPVRAIWAVPGLRQMTILRDATGLLSALKAQAEQFDWNNVKAAADAYASELLMGLAEEVHKLLNSLDSRDEMAATYAVLGLALGVTRAVGIHRGVLAASENSWLGQVESSVGVNSDWSRWHRITLGLDPSPSGQPAALLRAQSALRLYLETAALLEPILLRKDREVVRTTCELVRERLNLG